MTTAIEQSSRLTSQNELSNLLESDKFNIVSVMSFANGKTINDGVTDATTAIQDAIDYVETYGGIVFVPNGIYLITSSIILPLNNKKVRVVGESEIGTVFKSIIVSSSLSAIFRCIGTSVNRCFVSFENFKILGNDDALTIGIYMEYTSSYSKIKNVNITNCYDGIRIATDYNVNLRDVISTTNLNNGLTIGYDLSGSAQACNAVKISGGIFTGNTKNGINIHIARGVKIDGTIVEANGYANFNITYCNGVSIAGVYLEDNVTTATWQFVIYACVGVSINGVTISNFTVNQKIFYIAYSSGVKLSGIAIERGSGTITATGIDIFQSDVSIYASSIANVSKGIVISDISNVTIYTVDLANVTVPITTESNAFTSLNWNGAKSTYVSLCSFGVLSKVYLKYTDGETYCKGVFKAFTVNVKKTDIAAAAAKTLVPINTPNETWYIRDIFIVPSTNFSGGGGDRDLKITDGTFIWSVIPASILQTQVQARWGSVQVPYSATVWHMLQISTLGAPIYAAYDGGTADYTAGDINIIIIAERAT